MMAANPNMNGSGAIVTTTPPNRARPAHTKAIIEKTLDATAWFGGVGPSGDYGGCGYGVGAGCGYGDA